MKSLEVLYEDERFLAVDKPAGVLSIPGRDPREPSVTKILRRERKGEKFLVVHRIDRETTGVMLLAKTEEAHRLANEWFREHVLRKEYLALAVGSPRVPAFRVNVPVEEKASLSQVQVLERFVAGAFLARVRIASGRRHQIRIHLKHEGYPILGDPKYSGRRKFAGISFDRVALHAELLVLPAHGEDPAIEIRAPKPKDFQSWIEALREAPEKEKDE